MPTRPSQGGSQNTWGTELNAWLDIAHRSDGSPVPTRGIVLPKGWDAAWQAALANAGTTAAKAALLSYSVGRGYYASVLDTKGWFGLCRTSLQNTYGNGGSGFIGCGADLGSPNVVPTGYAAQMKVTKTGFAAAAVSSGPGLGDPASSTTVGNTLSFTGLVGSSIDIWYLTGAGLGSFTYAIDGGGPVTVNCAGSNGCSVVTATPGAGTHTMVITVTVTGGVQIPGVRARNATGVLLDNYSCQGVPSSALAGNATWGLHSLWSGGRLNPAHLVIVEMTLNDSTPDTAITNISAALDDIKDGAGSIANSILLIADFSLASWTNGPAQKVISQKLEGLSHYYGCGFISMGGRFRGSWQRAFDANFWSTGSGASGNPGSDPAHPGDIGHQMYADQILPLLTGLTPGDPI